MGDRDENPQSFRPTAAAGRATLKVVDMRPLEVISPARWQGRHAPPREWMVDQVSLKRTTCLFSGIGGIGKTLLMQQLMTACALDQPWLGKKVAACRSFALFGEDPEDEVWRRQEGICRYYGAEAGDLDDMTMVTLDQVDSPILYTAHPRDPTGRPTPLWERVEKHVREVGAQLVILDNVGACYGGNANYPEQVRPFLQLTNKLARDIDGLVVLIQHPSATGEQDQNAQAGARTWRNTVRSQVIMQLPRESDEEEPSDERIIRIGKNNYGRREAPMRIVWQAGVFAPVSLSTEKGGRLSMFEQAELRSVIASTMRKEITNGARFSLANGSKFHIATVLEKMHGFKRFHRLEIAEQAEAMLAVGQLVNVVMGSGTRRTVIVRPSDVTYPGEKVTTND